MSRRHLGLVRNITFAALTSIAVMGSAAPAAADETLTAVITARDDSTLTVAREKDGQLMIVDLNDSTKIRSGGDGRQRAGRGQQDSPGAVAESSCDRHDSSEQGTGASVRWPE